MKRIYDYEINEFVSDNRIDDSDRLTVSELQDLYSISKSEIDFYDLIYNYGYLKGAKNFG